MSLRFLWHNIGDRVGFFTTETAHNIPEGPGIYAWFLPLYTFDTDLAKYLETIQRLYLYDATCGDVGASEGRHEFAWDSLHLQVRKMPHTRLSDSLREEWVAALRDPELSEPFKRVLMEASLFMPPLYVGKADSLAVRYAGHVSGNHQDKDDFHNRFDTYVQHLGLNLTVSDLLFVCIQTDPDTNRKLYSKKGRGLHNILEQVIMRLARPPFSKK